MRYILLLPRPRSALWQALLGVGVLGVVVYQFIFQYVVDLVLYVFALLLLLGLLMFRGTPLVAHVSQLLNLNPPPRVMAAQIPTSEPPAPLTSTRIAFESYRDGARHIYVMDVDGHNVQKLQGVWNGPPAWSPDGTLIAFNCDLHICVMDATGRNVQQLTLGHGVDPVWSPDSF